MQENEKKLSVQEDPMAVWDVYCEEFKKDCRNIVDHTKENKKFSNQIKFLIFVKSILDNKKIAFSDLFEKINSAYISSLLIPNSLEPVLTKSIQEIFKKYLPVMLKFSESMGQGLSSQRGVTSYLTITIEENEEKLKKLEENRKSLETEIEILSKEKTNLNDQSTKLQLEIDRLRNERIELSGSIKTLTEIQASLTNMIKEKESIILKKTEENQDLNNTIQDLNCTIQDLNTTVENFRQNSGFNKSMSVTNNSGMFDAKSTIGAFVNSVGQPLFKILFELKKIYLKENIIFSKEDVFDVILSFMKTAFEKPGVNFQEFIKNSPHEKIISSLTSLHSIELNLLMPKGDQKMATVLYQAFSKMDGFFSELEAAHIEKGKQIFKEYHNSFKKLISSKNNK